MEHLQGIPRCSSAEYTEPYETSKLVHGTYLCLSLINKLQSGVFHTNYLYFLKEVKESFFFLFYIRNTSITKKKTQPPLLFDCGLSVLSQAFLGDTKFYYK